MPQNDTVFANLKVSVDPLRLERQSTIQLGGSHSKLSVNERSVVQRTVGGELELSGGSVQNVTLTTSYARYTQNGGGHISAEISNQSDPFKIPGMKFNRS